MRRRDVLRAGGLAATAALAGCSEVLGTGPAGEPPVVEDRPDAVYYPTHVEAMEMIGMAQRGDRAVALSYTFPHRFWTVTGTRTDRVDVTDDDSVHLMASVWDTGTGTVLPIESGLRFEIARDGETITERAPWPMLSQPMGFHFGDNVALPGDGTYAVTVDVGAANLQRRGPFAGKFEESGTVEFEFEYSRSERDAIDLRSLDDRQGEPGAVSPMDMEMVPLSVAPATDELPGRGLGEATSGGAAVVATASEPDGGNGDGTYLAIHPRTPHNRYVLPMMSLSARLDRDGATVFDDALRAAIDPDRAYHYAARVDDRVEAGDELTVTVDAPPQVSRHEGYETAFIEMPDVTIAV